MKVLILANYDVGLFKFRKELLEALLKDNEVFISLPYGGFVENMKQMGCIFIDTPVDRRGTNPIKDSKLVLQYRKIIKDIKPNVVLTYTIKPNVYGGIACQLEKVPYLVNVTGISSAIENGGIKAVIASTLYKIGIKKAYRVYFQNDANKEYMIKHHMVKNNYKVIPGSGVNLNQYQVKEYPNKDTIDFVYVGRIMAEKGFNQYADAAMYIRNKYPNTRFHVCGWYEDDYKEFVEKLIKDNYIVYHGLVSDMANIYEEIHCIIHATYYSEGLSNVLLEASSSGRSLITTNRPGCREVIIDGYNGYVVKEKDSRDLIKKIEQYLSLTDEQRKQMGLNARKNVEEKFDRNIVVDEYLNTIKSINI